MSLIIDALKKAQQLRMKEVKGVPFSQYPPTREKRSNLMSFVKRWMVIGTGLAALIVLLLLFCWPAPPPALKSDQTFMRIKKKPSRLAAVQKSEEPPRETLGKETLGSSKDLSKEVPGPSKGIASLPKETPSKDILSPSKGLTKETTGPPKEALNLPKETLHKEPLGLPKGQERKRETPKQAEEKKAIPVKPQTGAVAKAGPSIKTPPAEREEVRIKEEGEKSRVPTPEVLTHFNLGVSFFNQREMAKAVQAYQKAIALDPTYVEAYNNLGITYQELGDSTLAFEAYQKSIEINPQYEKGHNNLGILLYQKGREEEAIEAFQKALAINPNNVESHINLGILFKKRGQWDKGIESYKKALAINPLRGETHYNIALLYEQLGRAGLAIDHYRRFIQLSSSTYPDLVSKVQSHLCTLTSDKNDKGR